MARIVVLDYGMGNRRSVEKALERAGATVRLSADPAELSAAEGLVVPGVGAFPEAMRRLRETQLDQSVRAYAATGRPLLGICLGMQLLLDGSQEFSSTAGLGLIPGEVTALRAGGLRLPHIGWNEVRPERPSPLLGEPRPFYHVHSFVARPREAEHVLASAEYGERFATIVGRGNVMGVQFHPEKSSRDGLALLAAFAGLCAGTAGAASPAAASSVSPT
jgi:glutamine amidotransferase